MFFLLATAGVYRNCPSSKRWPPKVCWYIEAFPNESLLLKDGDYKILQPQSANWQWNTQHPGNLEDAVVVEVILRWHHDHGKAM